MSSLDNAAIDIFYEDLVAHVAEKVSQISGMSKSEALEYIALIAVELLEVEL